MDFDENLETLEMLAKFVERQEQNLLLNKTRRFMIQSAHTYENFDD